MCNTAERQGLAWRHCKRQAQPQALLPAPRQALLYKPRAPIEGIKVFADVRL